MHVYGLIFAGGIGSRMNYESKPKQFLEVDNKPIIVHTLEFFQKNPEVDEIVVVCVEDWIDYLKDKLKEFHIDKVKWIVPGGKTGQLSIYNGLKKLEENCADPDDAIVLIHDGVRPLINQQIIHDNIVEVQQNRTSVTVTPAIETVITVDENGSVKDTVDRSACRMAKAPQTFYLGDILKAHKKVLAEGKENMIDSATLMSYCGHKIFTVEGPSENIKITTPSDYYIFKTLYAAKNGQDAINVKEE